MTSEEIKKRVEEIAEFIGLSKKGVATLMNISQVTLSKKRNPKENGHTFNEKNLKDLIQNLKQKAQELE